MKKIILVLTIAGLLMGCIAYLPDSVHAGGGTITTETNNSTTGQELIALKQALDTGAITQAEYDELKLNIIERLDAPVDSTNTN